MFFQKKSKTKEYLRSLVDKMCDNTQPPPRPVGKTGLKAIFGSDSSSWKAYREAEKLKDYKYYEAAKELLREETHEEKRSKYYSILVKLWKGLQDENILISILESLKHETSNTLVRDKLHDIFLQFVPVDQAIPFVGEFLDHHDLRVNIAAAEVLSSAKRRDVELEKKVLRILPRVKSPYDIKKIMRALSGVGSEVSIPVIRDILPRIRDGESLGVSLRALSDLCKNKCEKIYADYLTNARSPYVKKIALECLYEYSNDQTIAQDVFKRAKVIVSREKRVEMHYQEEYPPEVVYCLMYLKKIRSDLFDDLVYFLKVHKGFLFDAEVRHIKRMFSIIL